MHILSFPRSETLSPSLSFFALGAVRVVVLCLMASSSYTPDEPHDTIIQEKTWPSSETSSLASKPHSASRPVLRRQTTNHNRLLIDLLVYVSVLFEVTTVGSQMAFITQRNYPGGPSAFLSDQYSTLVNLASTILVVCANWMMESLLVRPPPLSV